MGAEHRPGISDEAPENDFTLPLADFLRIIRKRLWIILLVAVPLLGATVGFSLMQTPVYESSIRILVGQDQGIIQNPGDVGALQQITQTMTEGVKSRPIAEEVIQRLNLEMTPEELLEQLSVERISDTQFIQVGYRDPSPERAQQVASTIGDVFSEQVSEVSPNASAITVTVWEQAEVPEGPMNLNPTRNGLLALVLGLMLGIGLAFLLEYLDDSWSSPEEVERISGIPTFGVIPEFEAPTGKKKGG